MTEPAKTQRRGELTKRHLIDATKKLLTEYNYQSVTLDRISRDVGVAKSSILWHFGSKERLLTEAVFSLFEEIDARINLVKSGLDTLQERIEYLLRTVADYFQANPGAKGIAVTLIFNRSAPEEIPESIRGHWRQHISDIKEFLAGDDDSISEAGAAGILALLHGTYLQWYLEGCPDGLQDRLLSSFYGMQLGAATDIVAAT